MLSSLLLWRQKVLIIKKNSPGATCHRTKCHPTHLFTKDQICLTKYFIKRESDKIENQLLETWNTQYIVLFCQNINTVQREQAYPKIKQLVHCMLLINAPGWLLPLGAPSENRPGKLRRGCPQTAAPGKKSWFFSFLFFNVTFLCDALSSDGDVHSSVPKHLPMLPNVAQEQVCNFVHLPIGNPTITASLCANTSDMPHCTCSRFKWSLMGWHLHQFFYHLKQTAPLFAPQKEGSKDLVNLKTCLVTKHPQGVWDARRARELRNYSFVTGRFPFWTSDCPRNVAADVKWLPVVIGDHFLHSRLLARCYSVNFHRSADSHLLLPFAKPENWRWS